MHRHKFFTACGGPAGGSGPAGGRGTGGPGGGSAGYTLHRRPGGGAGNCLDALPDRKKRQGSVAADSTTPDTSANVTLTLFGTLPVKTVRAVSTERRTVQVCGTPFGVKLFSDGALVVAFSDRYTALGSENPAKAAGLRLGD